MVLPGKKSDPTNFSGSLSTNTHRSCLGLARLSCQRSMPLGGAHNDFRVIVVVALQKGLLLRRVLAKRMAPVIPLHLVYNQQRSIVAFAEAPSPVQSSTSQPFPLTNQSYNTVSFFFHCLIISLSSLCSLNFFFRSYTALTVRFTCSLPSSKFALAKLTTFSMFSGV